MNVLKKIVLMAMVVVTTLTGGAFAGCGSCGPAAAPSKTADQEKAQIDTHVLAKLIDSGVDVTILDARAGKGADIRRIPGAKSLSPSVKAKEAKKVIKSKDSLIVTYCSNLKCGASAALASRLEELGYKNIIEYPFGIEGWQEHGEKVE